MIDSGMFCKVGAFTLSVLLVEILLFVFVGNVILSGKTTEISAVSTLFSFVFGEEDVVSKWA